MAAVPKPAQPSVSLAVKQVRQEKSYAAAAKRGLQTDTLRKENAKLQKQLAALQRADSGNRPGGGDDASNERGNEGMEVDSFEYTVDQLVAQKKMLLGFGKDESHPDVAKIVDQIKVQEAALLAIKPHHIRVARADKAIKQASAKRDQLVAKGAKLQDELAALQARIADNAMAVDRAQQGIDETEKQRDLLYAELRPTQEVHSIAAMGTPGDQLFQACEKLPVEFFDHAGLERKDVQALLRQLATHLPPVPLVASHAVPVPEDAEQADDINLEEEQADILAGLPEDMDKEKKTETVNSILAARRKRAAVHKNKFAKK